MKTKINIDDFLILMDIVYLDFKTDETTKFLMTNNNPALAIQTFVPSPSKFKYINLKEKADSYNITKTDIDITIHPIDEFMVDVYKSLCKLKDMIEEMKEYSDEFLFYDQIVSSIVSSKDLSDNISFTEKIKKQLFSEYKESKKIFEDIILNYDFTYPEISGIQKNYLNDMLIKSIRNEKFELSAQIRDKIENIKKKYE